jgi:hypothetical protein
MLWSFLEYSSALMNQINPAENVIGVDFLKELPNLKTTPHATTHSKKNEEFHTSKSPIGSPWPRHNNNNKHAYAGQLNSFTHLRALLVLHDRGIITIDILMPVNWIVLHILEPYWYSMTS